MNIVSLIKKYKSSVTRKYIFVSKDEIDTIPKNELLISKKIDGQLWFYCKSDKDSKIINTSESEISDIIQDIKKDLDKKLKKVKNIILAGELYCLSSERERYGDTISGLGDKSKRKTLRFGVFDVVHMEKLFPDFDKKYEFLKKTLNTNTKEPSHAIEQTKAKQSELAKFFKEKIEKNNAEGLIVRDNSSIYKIKQEETADLLLSLIHI